MSKFILALDTSTEFCSIAIKFIHAADDCKATTALFKHERLGNLSSTKILPLLNELLAEAQLSLMDCVAVAVGIGPGSFTGLRTAVGIAQGLAFALNIPTLAVNTLLACAECARIRYPEMKHFLSVLDARMQHVYWLESVWNTTSEQWEKVSEVRLTGIDEVISSKEPFVFTGHGPDYFQRKIISAEKAQYIDEAALPDARFIAQIGFSEWLKGNTLPADALLPEYVRNKVALTSIERQKLIS